MCFHILQHHTLYDRIFKKTIVIIMRDFKIIPAVMDKLYKDHVKLMKRDNNRLTNSKAECTIVKYYNKKGVTIFELAGQI